MKPLSPDKLFKWRVLDWFKNIEKKFNTINKNFLLVDESAMDFHRNILVEVTKVVHRVMGTFFGSRIKVIDFLVLCIWNYYFAVSHNFKSRNYASKFETCPNEVPVCFVLFFRFK